MQQSHFPIRAAALTSWLALAAIPLTGCLATEATDPPSDDTDTDMSTPEGHAGAGAASPEPEPPAFAEVYAVLQSSCGGGMSGCHITGMSAGLAMPDATTARATLVNVASTKCAGEMRVVPGDADSSLLVQVLDGSTTCVKPMPLGRDTLSAEDIELVRTWIDLGALE